MNEIDDNSDINMRYFIYTKEVLYNPLDEKQREHFLKHAKKFNCSRPYSPNYASID